MILYVLAAVQFVNVLDFMMVMPLGPDFARDLGMAPSQIGWVGGSYTFAAFLAGLAGSLFLDRFDRKKVLIFSLIGLSVGTALGGVATSLTWLLLARVVAGAFGGPATSATLAIVADLVAPERRGRAMGLVMSSFAVASVIGVPIGLELARIGGWQMPFFFVALLGFLTTVLAQWILPSMRGHLKSQKAESVAASLPSDPRFYREIFKPSYLWTWGLLSFGVFSTFLIVPNISAFLQYNLGIPRGRLSTLYFFGGIAAFFSSRLSGYWADRRGALEPVLLGTTSTLIVLFCGFAYPVLAVPTAVFFVGYMVSNNLRFVAFNTLSSKVPTPQFRARFMSMQSAVQHLMSSFAAFASSLILSTGDRGALVGMPQLVWLAACLVIVAPGMVYGLQRSLKQRT